jgi:hypothetical protein
MNGFEITELGQVREQENMLERAQSQALRRARRDADAGTGRLSRSRRTLRRRLAGLAG